MKKPLSFAELRTMSPARREQQLARVIREARQPPNGEIEALHAKVVAYEKRYGYSSETMCARIQAGKDSGDP
ncbi:MAG TPA: hypothetical protein VH165_19950, partial [Kofleriaceae bacterium]|nr:hypothetical protein [Kofleriaceae bacterium]